MKVHIACDYKKTHALCGAGSRWLCAVITTVIRRDSPKITCKTCRKMVET